MNTHILIDKALNQFNMLYML